MIDAGSDQGILEISAPHLAGVPLPVDVLDTRLALVTTAVPQQSITLPAGTYVVVAAVPSSRGLRRVISVEAGGVTQVVIEQPAPWESRRAAGQGRPTWLMDFVGLGRAGGAIARPQAELVASYSTPTAQYTRMHFPPSDAMRGFLLLDPVVDAVTTTPRTMVALPMLAGSRLGAELEVVTGWPVSTAGWCCRGCSSRRPPRGSSTKATPLPRSTCSTPGLSMTGTTSTWCSAACTPT
jgi:hypothetical protein